MIKSANIDILYCIRYNYPSYVLWVGDWHAYKVAPYTFMIEIMYDTIIVIHCRHVFSSCQGIFLEIIFCINKIRKFVAYDMS